MPQGAGQYRGVARIAWLGWVLVSVASYFAASYLFLLVITIFKLQQYFATTVGVLVAHVILLIVMLGLMQVTNRIVYRKGLSASETGIARALSWRDIGLGLAGFVLYALLSMVALALARTFPGFAVDQAQDIGVTTLFGMERLLGFVVLVIITPLLEELFFRGIVYGKLQQTKLGVWPAIIIVSALFAAAHGQWNVAVDVFCLSVVAAYLRESTGSIWAGVIIHMTKNLIAFYFMFVVMRGVSG